MLKFCPKQRSCCNLGLREASLQLLHWGSKLEISSKPQEWNMKARKKYITFIAVLSLTCNCIFNQSVSTAVTFHTKSQKPTFQSEKSNTMKTHPALNWISYLESCPRLKKKFFCISAKLQHSRLQYPHNTSNFKCVFCPWTILYLSSVTGHLA